MPENTISIFIDRLRVNIRIGLLPHERQAPQPVEVSAELFCDADTYRSALKSGGFLDYDRIAQFIKSWEQRPHVDLLETYLQEFQDFAFTFPVVQSINLRLSKQTIYPNACGAGVELRTTRLKL
ncbi:MAG: dihydroneopterin aldolase [Alphaproteobacteria bacterium]|nr:dihydroneopterin aldolase [Alphaproteobacteria bacterium]